MRENCDAVRGAEEKRSFDADADDVAAADDAGGTGDAAIWIGKQLMSYPKSEVVYIDFCKTSMNIAQKRAKIQGITNIKWIENSILNIPNLKLGKFDYVNCSGVLMCL